MGPSAKDPTAHGMVLATLVDGAGKPIQGGSARGQLYVSSDEIALVRPRARTEILNRVAMLLLVGPVVAVVVNAFAWKSATVLWVSAVALALYSLALPMRRRAFEPLPLTGAELAAANRGGRVAIRVHVRDIVRAVAPEPARAGFRRPARFELAKGALEIYLSPEQFHSVASSLGR